MLGECAEPESSSALPAAEGDIQTRGASEEEAGAPYPVPGRVGGGGGQKEPKHAIPRRGSSELGPPPVAHLGEELKGPSTAKGSLQENLDLEDKQALEESADVGNVTRKFSLKGEAAPGLSEALQSGRLAAPVRAVITRVDQGISECSPFPRPLFPSSLTGQWTDSVSKSGCSS